MRTGLSLRAAGCRGQASLEYLIVAGVLLAAVVMIGIFLYTFREQGDRLLNIAASEYP